MAHPYARESARSTARRMRVIGKSDGGKAWGSTATNKRGRKSYPSTNAGTQVPYFAEGGSVAPRADRLASGGVAKPRGGGKGTTINVIVAPQEGGPPAAPSGPPPMRMPVAGPPPGGPVPVGGPPPVGALSPLGAPPVGGPPLARSPGMAKGGGVPKAQLGMAVPPRPVRPAVAAAPPALAGRAAAVRKVGALANRGALANKAAVNRAALHDAQVSNNLSADRAAGRMMKRGGKRAKGGAVHDDEAKDKKLFRRMINEHEKKEGDKMASGGRIKQGGDGTAQQGEPGGYPVMKNAGGGGLGRLEKRSKGEV